MINHNFYLAFGAYGITVFPEMSAEKIGNRKDLARILRISEDRLAQLEMFIIDRPGTTSAAAVFKQAGKVSYVSGQPPVSIDSVLNSALDVQLKGGGKIRLDSGVTAILAQTQWGKTTFTSRDLVPSISKVIPDQSIDYISFLEPLEDLSFEAAKVNLNWISNHADFFRALADFLLSDRKVCVVDSLRSFIYDNSVGGTAAGGMDAYLPIQLTALSNVASQFGKHIIVTINPMMPAATEEERGKFYDLQKRIESSVPTVMTSTASRTLVITMRGPSSPSSQNVSYTVPAFDITRSVKADQQSSRVPAGTTTLRKADAVSNVIAGVVSTL